MNQQPIWASPSLVIHFFHVTWTCYIPWRHMLFVQTNYFATYFSIEPTSKHGRIFVVWAIRGWHNTSPVCRKNVGFDEFYGGAQLEGIGRVDHIFIGSRNLSPTAGTKAWGDGLRPLWIETFGINIVNLSSNFAVHRTTGFYFVQDTM